MKKYTSLKLMKVIKLLTLIIKKIKIKKIKIKKKINGNKRKYTEINGN